MNHIYRLVFNRVLGVRQAVSELAKASGKGRVISALAVGLFSPAAFAVSYYTVTDEAALRTALGSAIDGDVIVFGRDITLSSDLAPITQSIDIRGSGHVLSGNDAYRGFFVQQGTVEISDLDIAHATAQGGSGGGNGGGGMGAGGGLFVNSGAAVTLSNVRFDGNRAIGGSGGASGWDSGGGGGMAGGGADRLSGSNAGGGLGGGGGSGGTLQVPATPGGALVGSGGAAGSPPGINPAVAFGGDGDVAFSGGGGGVTFGTGGTGGDFAGGGGGGAGAACGPGGSGGFGGGGGGGGCDGRTAEWGGTGGFGAGGGGNGGVEGFGGGRGAAVAGLGRGIGGGGGGGGFGGAVFVRNGGSLTIASDFGFQNNSVAGGNGGPGLLGGNAGSSGSSAGSNLFLQGNGNLGISPGSGVSVVLDTATIADQSALGGIGSNAGLWGLIKTGDGVLQLTGTAGFSGSVQIDQGSVATAADASLGRSGQLGLNGGTLQYLAGFTSARSITLGAAGGTFDTQGFDSALEGSVSGAGQLIKRGSGTLVLSGANTHEGGTAIQGGVLSITSDGNLGAASGRLDFAGGTLRNTGAVSMNRAVTLAASGGTFETQADLLLSGDISGRGRWTKEGGSTLVVTGAASHTGGTTISGGTLQIGNGGTTGSLTGDVLNNATLAFNRSDALSFNGAITGSGNVVKSGAGTLTLAGANTYAGGTTVNAGILAGSASSFGSGAIVDNATLRIDQAGDAIFANPISGSGTLMKTGAGTLSLSGANSYAGGTTVTQGTLSIAADQNLGAASGALNLDGGTLRTTSAFATARNVDLGAGGGTLQTAADLSASGIVSGAGALTKTGAGTLTLTGANTYAGGTTINAGTLAGSAASFGSGAIANNAALRIDQPEDATLANTVSGSGTVTKTGAGTLTLSGENSYSGGTDLKQGRLAVGNNRALGSGELAMHEGTILRFAADGLSLANPIAFTEAVDPFIDTGAFTATLTGAITGPGDLSKIGSGTLILAGANTYSGATTVAEGTLRAGAANTFSPASAHSVNPAATLDLAGFSQSVAALTNAGTVSLIGSAPGTTLTVTGPYVGNNGLLRLGTALGDSASVSDRLILSGPSAVASGRTTVQVVNLGGLGALTTGNGIELVSAQGGATTTAQSTQDAFALQGGHVDAGAYEYRLQPGDAAGAGENWYLRSTRTVVVPPVSPEPPGASAPAIEVPTYRAEVPLFAALPEQLRQGNLAMLGNLHRRIGDDDVRTAASAQGLSDTSDRRAWGRVLSTRQSIEQSGTVTPQSEGRFSGLQAGTDLWSDAHWRTGLYVGQLDGDLQVKGFARGIANLAVGSNDLRSQYLGGYATWTHDSGFYADAVLQAGRHRYEVKPQTALRTKGKASSLSASLEIGQAFALGEGWQIEPQAQLVHQRIDLDDVDIAGARVRQAREGSWLARVGVRVKGDIATSAGRLQPYGRVNVYRTAGGSDTTRFISPAASTAIASSTGSTSTELAAGFTLGLSESTSLYGEVGKLWASGGDARVKSQLDASVGLRVRW